MEMKKKVLELVKYGGSLWKKKSSLSSKAQASCAPNDIFEKVNKKVSELTEIFSHMNQSCRPLGLLTKIQSYSQRSFIKFGLSSVLTGVIATAGYATYAYTLDEVDDKTKRLREYQTYNAELDSSTLKKCQALLYSATMTVPAKSIELYLDLRRPIEEQVRRFTEPSRDKLLPDMHPREQEKRIFTLVLDLDETLIHSDWKSERGWRTFKRPGVDAFLEHLAQFYEIVVYSDMLDRFFDPIIERLDENGFIRYRLSRHATKYQNGKFYRDLSKLNREPSRILYVSGHALESALQSENCVPVKSWKLEANDTTLLDLIPFLEFVGRNRPDDIRTVLTTFNSSDIASEFNRHHKEFQRTNARGR